MRVLIFGATGMVGQGVLQQALAARDVLEVVSLSRRTTGVKDDKLVEIIHEDFFNYGAVEDRLAGIDAVFFCLGVSSFRMSEEDYGRMTHELTMTAARGCTIKIRRRSSGLV